MAGETSRRSEICIATTAEAESVGEQPDFVRPISSAKAPQPLTSRFERGLRSPVMTMRLLDRVLSIGADPRETADERFRKRLLVGVALIILPIGFVWGVLYWIIGEHEVALTPWAYVTGSAISLAVFARTRSFAFLRTAQLFLILVAPAAGTLMPSRRYESWGRLCWAPSVTVAAKAAGVLQPRLLCGRRWL
jgi:hypothetical protein